MHQEAWDGFRSMSPEASAVLPRIMFCNWAIACGFCIICCTCHQVSGESQPHTMPCSVSEAGPAGCLVMISGGYKSVLEAPWQVAQEIALSYVWLRAASTQILRCASLCHHVGILHHLLGLPFAHGSSISYHTTALAPKTTLVPETLDELPSHQVVSHQEMKMSAERQRVLEIAQLASARFATRTIMSRSILLFCALLLTPVSSKSWNLEATRLTYRSWRVIPFFVFGRLYCIARCLGDLWNSISKADRTARN